MSKTLFHGNNQKWIDEFYVGFPHIPDNWTTGPSEAMNMAWNIARKFDSRMVVLAYPDAPTDEVHFKKDPTCGSGYGNDLVFPTQWHRCIKQPFKTYDDKSANIEMYNQDDLEAFLAKYAPVESGGIDSRIRLRTYLGRL